MNDKDLADRIVALGVGKHPVMLDLSASCFKENEDLYSIDSNLSFGRWNAGEFVRDWRVAGAMLEKVWDNNIEKDDLLKARFGLAVEWCYPKDSLPRAIIEACCGVLND